MQAVIANALRQRVLVIILGAVLMIGGLFAYRTLNIEAYPDPVPPLVDIITQNPGQSSEEIERYITVPIEIQMAGLPYVQAIRTISLFGLSDVKVQFTYDVSYQQASQMVINRLSQLSPLPNGVQPSVVADQPDRRDLPLSRGRPAGLFGGRPQDHPGLDPAAPLQGDPRRDRRHRLGRQDQDLRHHHRSRPAAGLWADLKQVLDGLNNANINVGANTVNIGSQSAIVRSVGQIRTMDDIRNTMLTVRDGAPVLVSDVATRDRGQPAAARHRGPKRRQ